MRTKLGALMLLAGAALAAVPAGPAAADPAPIRVATIAAEGSGECWDGSAEGRLSWTPGGIVDTVRVTATVVSVEMTDPRCGLSRSTRATYLAYSGTSIVDSRAFTATDETVYVGFTFTAPALTSIDRVEVRICWRPDIIVPAGSEIPRVCDSQGVAVS